MRLLGEGMSLAFLLAVGVQVAIHCAVRIRLYSCAPPICTHIGYITTCCLYKLRRVQSRSLYGYHSLRPMHDMTDRLILVNIVRHILMPSPGVIHSHIPPVNPL